MIIFFKRKGKFIALTPYVNTFDKNFTEHSVKFSY